MVGVILIKKEFSLVCCYLNFLFCIVVRSVRLLWGFLWLFFCMNSVWVGVIIDVYYGIYFW